MGIILSTFPQVLQLLARFHGDGHCAAAAKALQPLAVPVRMRPLGRQSRDHPSSTAQALATHRVQHVPKAGARQQTAQLGKHHQDM